MKFLSAKNNRRLFYILLFVVSTSLSFASNGADRRNLLLIAVMGVCPLFLLFYHQFLRKIDIPVIVIVTLTFSTQIFFNYATFRASTVLFSCMFYVFFLAAVRVFYNSNMQYRQLIRAVRWLIIAYALVLIFQQICAVLDLPVFNRLTHVDNPLKVNSLGTEPSHSVRYVGVLFYTYLVTMDKLAGRSISLTESFRCDVPVWLSMLYVMIMSISGTGILVLLLLLTKYVSAKNILYITGFSALVIGVGLSSDFEPLQRSSSFVVAAATLDPGKMMDADQSAAIRTAPVVLCARRLNPMKLSTWVGEGIDTTKKWMPTMVPGMLENTSFGGLFNLAVEYGLLLVLVFGYFSFRWCYDPAHRITTIGLWFLCVFMEGINMQMAWMCILMLYINKRYFVNKGGKLVLKQTA